VTLSNFKLSQLLIHVFVCDWRSLSIFLLVFPKNKIISLCVLVSQCVCVCVCVLCVCVCVCVCASLSFSFHLVSGVGQLDPVIDSCVHACVCVYECVCVCV